MIFPRPHPFITRIFLNNPLGLSYRPREGIHSIPGDRTHRSPMPLMVPCTWCTPLGPLYQRRGKCAGKNTWICHKPNFPQPLPRRRKELKPPRATKNRLAGQGRLSDPLTRMKLIGDRLGKREREREGLGDWGTGLGKPSQWRTPRGRQKSLPPFKSTLKKK